MQDIFLIKSLNITVESCLVDYLFTITVKKEKERDYIIETVLPALVEALKPIGDYTEFFNEYLELKKNELFYKV